MIDQSQNKQVFEKKLQTFLKAKLIDYPYLRVNKKCIFIENKKGFRAKISWSYLSASLEYAFSLSVNDIAIRSFIDQLSPPYMSNIANTEMIYSSYYASEDNCSDIFPIMLPRTEEGIERACYRVARFFTEKYLKRVYHLMEAKTELINDILENPNYYAFPFLTALYVIKKNHLDKAGIDLELLLSEDKMGYLNDKNLKASFNKTIAQKWAKALL
ncbi:hypothetical protein [Commensalibacter communis]|uniref:hypothetical protein n=1 Tax=Commensalibacter communis TaxID=2972786 RepID=UPI0022FF792F|nr:hypothetical protein [Commensalibacter communis]CAI3922262.1 unnamed protein product [Commensalibacter communis]CAI3932813.1 unnamed protein product [Commensalibacter communis]